MTTKSNFNVVDLLNTLNVVLNFSLWLRMKLGLMSPLGGMTGFGKASGKGSFGDGCHICGHPGHYARDCPDRHAPKGKGRMYHMGCYEDDMLYAFQKGKGKTKGKSGKNMHLMDELFYMRGKGYGNKGKGKSKTKNYGNVNAYYADYEEPMQRGDFGSSNSSQRKHSTGCRFLFGIP
eukprot:s416_g11.t1